MQYWKNVNQQLGNQLEIALRNARYTAHIVPTTEHNVSGIGIIRSHGQCFHSPEVDAECQKPISDTVQIKIKTIAHLKHSGNLLLASISTEQ